MFSPVHVFIKNISQLLTVAAHGQRAKVGREMRNLGIVRDAAVLCRDGRIAWVGPMKEWRHTLPEDVMEIDAEGKVVLPGFIDSHTHMMFAGDRADEFAQRSQGATYQQIAERGGGIRSTVAHVRAATKKQLKKQTAHYLSEAMKAGTTTVEIKSGYGLEKDAEIRMLEAINELKNEEVTTVVPTFLGAHAVPPEFTGAKHAYVEMLVSEMIPYVAKRKLAAFCDVFCEAGYFDVQESETILLAAKRWQMIPKVHADELTSFGGAELAARVGAASADHLEHVSDGGIQALREAGVVATVLPGVSFFLNHGYAPVRKLIDENVAVALASDFNPGSCMSFSMPIMMTIACTQMNLCPEEAITAATINAAAALNLSSTLGSIEPGKDADLVVADIPDYMHLVYHFGVNHVCAVIKHGTLLEL